MMHIFAIDELNKSAARLRLAGEHIATGAAHADDEASARRHLADALSEIIHVAHVLCRTTRDEYRIENAERFDPTHLHRVASVLREGADVLEEGCECPGLHEGSRCAYSGMPKRVETEEDVAASLERERDTAREERDAARARIYWLENRTDELNKQIDGARSERDAALAEIEALQKNHAGKWIGSARHHAAVKSAEDAMRYGIAAKLEAEFDSVQQAHGIHTRAVVEGIAFRLRRGTL